MTKHKWKSIDPGLLLIQAPDGAKVFCSSFKKLSPLMGKYECMRCKSIGRVLSDPVKIERGSFTGYFYRVSDNWKSDCDISLIANIHSS